MLITGTGTGMKMSRYDGARTSQHKPEPASRPHSILLFCHPLLQEHDTALHRPAPALESWPNSMRRSLAKWPGPGLACSNSHFLGTTSSSPRASRAAGLDGRGPKSHLQRIPSITQTLQILPRLRSSPTGSLSGTVTLRPQQHACLMLVAVIATRLDLGHHSKRQDNTVKSLSGDRAR